MLLSIVCQNVYNVQRGKKAKTHAKPPPRGDRGAGG